MWRRRAASSRRCASRPICRGLPPTASSLEDIRQAIVNANVAGPKGAFDGAFQSYTIAANDQLAAAEAYRTLVIAYRNRTP